MPVDEVLKVWYIVAVGEKSAPFLQQYFNFWEDYCTKRVPSLKQYFNSGNILLSWKSKEYMDLLTVDDLTKLDYLRNSVFVNANSGKQRKRAKFFQKSFELLLGKITEYIKS